MNPGTNKLATILSDRMKEENRSPAILDFGTIQGDYSLLTNTFPIPIHQSDYMVCRQLTVGAAGTALSVTLPEGSHTHSQGTHGGHEYGDGSHSHDGGVHVHTVPVPEKLRSLLPGDRVLVAWVGNEAVIIDIILPGSSI